MAKKTSKLRQQLPDLLSDIQVDDYTLPSPIHTRIGSHAELLQKSPDSLPTSPQQLLTHLPESSPGREREVLVIYTGGTFGMTPNEHGVLFPTSGFLAKKIATMDEFKHKGMPKVEVLEWEEPIDSSDMNLEQWTTLALQIQQYYWNVDGFVILHGTDTMAYTASALSFMLEHLGKPVVVAGAMIPLHFPHSDARRNLIMSVLCAGTLDIPEVVIYSNDQLLRGNRTTKTANLSVDAFQSPNHPILARTGVETMVDYGVILPHPHRRFSIFTSLHQDVCVFRLIPGFSDDSLRCFIAQRKKNPVEACGIVFCLYGTGNAPLRKTSFLELIADAIDAGVTVVIISQCPYGRTKLDAYATGVKLLDMGVITAHDMTVEGCVTKLAYLMGKGIKGAMLKKSMEMNLRGEMTIIPKHSDYSESVGIRSTNSQQVIQNMVNLYA